MNRSDLIAQFDGAQLATDEISGFTVALHFGDQTQEYRAIRSGVALFDRTDQTLLRIAGPDCRKFLQGYVTSDVASLESGRGALAGVTDQMGKAIADCRVYAREEAMLIECDGAATAGILKHLGRYAPFSKSKIEDVAEAFGILSVQGPRSRALLETLLNDSLEDLPSYGCQTIQIESTEILACKVTHTGEEGYDLVIPAGHIPKLWRTLVAGRAGVSAQPAGAAAREVARIEAAIPRFGKDFDASNGFLESGLDDAVSYAKGCYLGQEIIARIHFRGHVPKRLATIALEGGAIPSSGDRVFSLEPGEKEAGRVTSACFSPALGKPLAFAMLKYDFLARGAKLAVSAAGQRIAAEVVKAPFAWERESIAPPSSFVARTMPVTK